MERIEGAPVKPTISFDVLDQIDVRVGTIELVEDVRGSEKLVRLTVDFGDHKRRILVGMKQERQDPKEVEGKQALFVVNLEPKQMMGEVSEGMLFDIGPMGSRRCWRCPKRACPTVHGPGDRPGLVKPDCNRAVTQIGAETV